MGRLKTAEGIIEYAVPQMAGRDEPWRSAIAAHLKGHAAQLEDLAAELLARELFMSLGLTSIYGLASYLVMGLLV